MAKLKATLVFYPVEKQSKVKKGKPKKGEFFATVDLSKPVKPTFTLPVPSINEYYAIANAAMRSRGQWGTRMAANFISEWRARGFDKAKEYLKETNQAPFLITNARVEIVIHWADKRRRDAHNLFYKPLLDGMTDAGFWTDDSVISEFSIVVGPIDKSNPRVEFMIYELE